MLLHHVLAFSDSCVLEIKSRGLKKGKAMYVSLISYVASLQVLFTQLGVGWLFWKFVLTKVLRFNSLGLMLSIEWGGACDHLLPLYGTTSKFLERCGFFDKFRNRLQLSPSSHLDFSKSFHQARSWA